LDFLICISLDDKAEHFSWVTHRHFLYEFSSCFDAESNKLPWYPQLWIWAWVQIHRCRTRAGVFLKEHRCNYIENCAHYGHDIRFASEPGHAFMLFLNPLCSCVLDGCCCSAPWVPGCYRLCRAHLARLCLGCPVCGHCAWYLQLVGIRAD
jgi:hypothetical protein